MASLAAAYVGLHQPRDRFRAAVRLAGVIRPMMVLLRLHRRGPNYPTRFDARVQSLTAVLRGVRRFAMHVPVDVRVDGEAPTSGPLLIVSTHNLLNQLFVARLAERGVRLSLVVRFPDPPYVAGCPLPMDLIATEPAVTMLRTVMSRLDAGHVVFAAIDRSQRLDTHPHRLPTPGPEWYCSSQLIRLAVERSVPVAFCLTRLEGLSVITTLRRADAADTLGIVRQFGEFMAEQLREIGRRGLYNGRRTNRSVDDRTGDVPGEAR